MLTIESFSCSLETHFGENHDDKQEAKNNNNNAIWSERFSVQQ